MSEHPTAKVGAIVALLALSSCSEPGSMNHCHIEHVRSAMAFNECSSKRLCVLQATEYAWLQNIKRLYPQCFAEGVER